MRAWWSTLFVPHSAANFRYRYAPSFENFAEPSQKTESGPERARMSIIFSAISPIAASHVMRCHWPPTSFIGNFRRRSPCTSSRTEAPLAQCVPRLIGDSHAGSWPTHTPFCTSATTVQPTEQCVQMFLTRWIGWLWLTTPIAEPGAACAMRGARPASAATPAAPSPACLKNERRSSPPEDSPS